MEILEALLIPGLEICNWLLLEASNTSMPCVDYVKVPEELLLRAVCGPSVSSEPVVSVDQPGAPSFATLRSLI